MRPRFFRAATTAPVVTVRFFAYSVYAVALDTTCSTKPLSTPRTSSNSKPEMRLMPARRARRRTEPLVMPRTLSLRIFFMRLPDAPFDDPDLAALAMVTRGGLLATNADQGNQKDTCGGATLRTPPEAGSQRSRFSPLLACVGFRVLRRHRRVSCVAPGRRAFYRLVLDLRGGGRPFAGALLLLGLESLLDLGHDAAARQSHVLEEGAEVGVVAHGEREGARGDALALAALEHRLGGQLEDLGHDVLEHAGEVRRRALRHARRVAPLAELARDAADGEDEPRALRLRHGAGLGALARGLLGGSGHG